MSAAAPFAADRLRLPEILVAATIASAYLWFSATDLLVELGGDNAVYWLTANHYSPYGATHPLAAEIAAASKYPPLYPAALALLGGGTSVYAAHLVSALLLCLGLFATRALYLALGIPRGGALALVALLAVLPVMRFGATELQSEDLFLPLSIAALTIMVQLERRDDGGRLLLLGVLTAAAMLTRTAAVALVAALVAQALTARRPRWLLALVPVVIAWTANSFVQHSAGRYAGELFEVYARGGVLEQLRVQLLALPFEWGRAIGTPIDTWTAAGARAPLGLALVLVALGRGRHLTADGLYALAYLALVLLWPFPAEIPRLLSMILPVLLGQAYLAVAGLRAVPAHVRGPLAACAVAGPLLVFALPDTVQYVTRLVMPVPAELRPLTRSVAWQRYEPVAALKETALLHAVYATMLDIERLVPPGECVYSIKPSIVSLYGRRRSRLTPPVSDKAAFEAAAKAGGCRYFMLSLLVSPQMRELFHPYGLLREDLVVLAQHVDPFDDSGILMAALAEWRPPADSP